MKSEEKKKQGIPRLLEVSGERNTSMAVSVFLSIAGTICQLSPFVSVYKIMAELLSHAASGEALRTGYMIHWAAYGLIGLVVGYILVYAGGMMSHRFAYRVYTGCG